MELVCDDLRHCDLAPFGAAQHDAVPDPLRVEASPGDHAMTCKFTEKCDIALDPLPDPL